MSSVVQTPSPCAFITVLSTGGGGVVMYSPELYIRQIHEKTVYIYPYFQPAVGQQLWAQAEISPYGVAGGMWAPVGVPTMYTSIGLGAQPAALFALAWEVHSGYLRIALWDVGVAANTWLVVPILAGKGW